MRNEVLQRAIKQLQSGKTPEEALTFLANTLTNKLLHTPSSQIRQAGFDGEMDLLEAANTLFQIKDTESR
jgi:glutamyl-tRNA reductase